MALNNSKVHCWRRLRQSPLGRLTTLCYLAVVVSTDAFFSHAFCRNTHAPLAVTRAFESFLCASRPDGEKRTSRKQSKYGSRAPGLAFILAGAIVGNPLQPETTITASPQSPIPEIHIGQSRAWALSEQQLLVDDVWREVTRQYVDRSFNGMGEDLWRKKRLDAVTKAAEVGPDDTEKVYQIIRGMLENLGDPYTRFLTPEQFEVLATYARGAPGKAGIGVQLGTDFTTGQIVVVNAVRGGPAEMGGIRAGDTVYEVDYMDMNGAAPEVVAAKCRGEQGTEVTLAVRHPEDRNPSSALTRTTLRRELIKPVQVEASTLASSTGKRIGVIRVPSFSLETEKQVREALNQLRKSSSAIAIDLRGNVGGYMPAGVDVAKLFLPAQARVVSEVDKTGRATIYFNDGITSESDIPLYVLVDKKTASASEIFAAAMQDNHRATIVGTRTFGKGRIQNLQELQFGCGVAVTKAKYITPGGKDIQGVGIQPDVESPSCGPEDSPVTCLLGVI